MKVLHMNCVYPNGSTGNITKLIHKALLNSGNSSLVVYGRGKNIKESNTIRICNNLFGKINHFIARCTGYMYGGCFFETIKIINIIKKEKPDIIHLQCINGNFVNIYRLISYLKQNDIKTVLTLHAEFMYTANCALSLGCMKWKNGCVCCENFRKASESFIFNNTNKSYKKMLEAFSGFEENLYVVAVSKWLENNAKTSKMFCNNKITTILNGVNTKFFHPYVNNFFKDFSEKYKDKKIILWVTSGYTYDKGSDYFRALVEIMDKEKYVFFVVGTEKQPDYGDNVVFFGKINDKVLLAKLYSISNVTLSCSRQESYPTTFVESQSCGTPVVGFNVGGVKETIYSQMGQVVTLGDIEELKLAVEFWGNVDKKKIADISLNYANENSSMKMVREYLELYKYILENGDEKKCEI